MTKILCFRRRVHCADCGRAVPRKAAVFVPAILDLTDDEADLFRGEELWFCPECAAFEKLAEGRATCASCGALPSIDTGSGFILGRMRFQCKTDNGDSLTLSQPAYICGHCAKALEPTE